ncbi:MAG: putative DNA binding domain-containing protein [Roseburia sp.]|nr:putative DNA binding domain-containing protein [Roseburia sp.]MCM1241237.1 putative DNA binding domain-containing protein [Roseburia sp.]
MAEKHNIEWKTYWKDEYLAWICGFANAQGGKLYIGVDDNGSPVGLQNSKKLMEDLPNKIRDAMGIIVNIFLNYADGKEYLEIEVPTYPIPISCKGVYYYRSGSTNQKLSGVELESFILRRRGINWEDSPIPYFQIDDISDNVIKYFKEKATEKGRLESELLNESKKSLIEKLYLKNGEYLTNAAALLFSEKPERLFLGAYIKIGFFENDAELVYQDEIHGSLLQQVDKALDLIYFKYLKAKIFYKGIQRIEKYPFPKEALREALLNAIVHKDYSSKIPIQVSVYDNKLYIANVGILPETWTLENLMTKHVSLPFNPNIAHVFYLAGFIESWGRGIEKIYESCKADGLPEPEYTVHQRDIMIKFTTLEDRVITIGKSKVNDRVNDKVNDRVNDSEMIVLNLLYENPAFTYTEIAERTNISRKTIAARMKSLQEKGIVERIGTNKKGYWKINR